MPEEQERLNPQITDVEIGIRNLRKIKVYPLSMSDQLKLTDMVTKSATEQMAKGDGDIAIVSFVLQLIQENLSKIITMVTDEKADVLEDMSNSQAVEFADVLLEVNYGAVVKNFKSLSKKLTGLFQSERPLPPSVSDTATGSKTSTVSPIKTEE